MQNKVYTAQKKECQLNRTAAYKTAGGLGEGDNACASAGQL
ncbi:hypothetical protein ACPAVH_34075 [Enterobacteriaceae bacterium TYF_5]